jgi:hypothetical protein
MKIIIAILRFIIALPVALPLFLLGVIIGFFYKPAYFLSVCAIEMVGIEANIQ